MFSDKENKKEEKTPAKSGKNIALKDWKLFSPPEIDITIKKGDDLSEIPEKFHHSLIVEGVMKG